MTSVSDNFNHISYQRKSINQSMIDEQANEDNVASLPPEEALDFSVKKTSVDNSAKASSSISSKITLSQHHHNIPHSPSAATSSLAGSDLTASFLSDDCASSINSNSAR